MQEKRSHDRYPVELDIVIVHDGVEHPGKTRDMSLGGMFVHTSAALRFGSDAILRLQVPEQKYTGELPVIVRWTKNDGVGLAFKSLRARDVHALNGLFKRFL